jgi:hypothetical protein
MKCGNVVGKKRFNGSVTHGLRKQHVLRLPPLILDKVRSYMQIISHDTSWDVRELYIRKTADLPLQLCVDTFPCFVTKFDICSHSLYFPF